MTLTFDSRPLHDVAGVDADTNAVVTVDLTPIQAMFARTITASYTAAIRRALSAAHARGAASHPDDDSRVRVGAATVRAIDAASRPIPAADGPVTVCFTGEQTAFVRMTIHRYMDMVRLAYTAARARGIRVDLDATPRMRLATATAQAIGAAEGR